MDTVYPASTSALARGRRLRRAEPRLRRRTAPVTFAEIKEVDEEASEVGACERRRPDVLEERLGRQFAEFRRRRARDALPEREPESPPPAAGPARAGSDPAQLDRCDPAQLDLCDPAQLDLCDPAQLDLCDPAQLDRCDPAPFDRCDPAQLNRCDPAQLDRCDPAQLDLCDPAPDT